MALDGFILPLGEIEDGIIIGEVVQVGEPVWIMTIAGSSSGKVFRVNSSFAGENGLQLFGRVAVCKDVSLLWGVGAEGIRGGGGGDCGVAVAPGFDSGEEGEGGAVKLADASGEVLG